MEKLLSCLSLVLLASDSTGGNGGKNRKPSPAEVGSAPAPASIVGNVKVTQPSHSFFGLIGRIVHETEEEIEVLFGELETEVKHLFSKADVVSVSEPVTPAAELPGQPAPETVVAPAAAPAAPIETAPVETTPPASGK